MVELKAHRNPDRSIETGDSVGGRWLKGGEGGETVKKGRSGSWCFLDTVFFMPAFSLAMSCHPNCCARTLWTGTYPKVLYVYLGHFDANYSRYVYILPLAFFFMTTINGSST